MKKQFLLIIALIGFTTGSLLAMDLDGTAWRIHEKGKSETEDLIFVNGQFTSSGCVPYGFLTASYSSSKQGDAISWQSTVTNNDKETMAWQGKTVGKDIRGTYLFTDKKGKSWKSEWIGKKIEAK